MTPKKQIKNSNRQIFKRLGTQFIRDKCCWNCFEVGHLRFQCPKPKVEACSFCQTSGVRSNACSCTESKLHFSLPEQEEIINNNQRIQEPVKNTEYGPFQEIVPVPVNIDGEIIQYVQKENI